MSAPSRGGACRSMRTAPPMSPVLYGAGDQVGNILCHVSGAATMGRIAGESAAAYVKGREQAGSVVDHPVVKEKQALYSTFMDREFGTSWKDMNTALNQLMDDYAGGYKVRSEHLLQAGIKYLNDLRQLSLKRLRCTTAHELMRAWRCSTLWIWASWSAGLPWSARRPEATTSGGLPLHQPHTERLLRHRHQGPGRPCDRHPAGQPVKNTLFCLSSFLI